MLEPEAKAGLVLAAAIIAVTLFKMFMPVDLPPTPPNAALNLLAAREQFVMEHKGTNMVSEDGFGDCKLGPEDTMLICGVHESGPYVHMNGSEVVSTVSVDWLGDLCTRGFKKLVISGSERQLDCRLYPRQGSAFHE
jgi:hypothetical protein